MVVFFLFYFNHNSLYKEWNETVESNKQRQRSLWDIFFHSWNITMNYHIKNKHKYAQTTLQTWLGCFPFIQIPVYTNYEDRRQLHSGWYIMLWILNLLCGCKMQDLQVVIMYKFKIYNIYDKGKNTQWVNNRVCCLHDISSFKKKYILVFRSMSTRHLLNETWLIYILEWYSVECFAVNLQVFT